MSIGDKTAVVGQVWWRNARQRRLVNERGHLEVDALAHWYSQCSCSRIVAKFNVTLCFTEIIQFSTYL